MADRPGFDDTLKRVFDANLRCYEGLSRVTADYLQALARVWTEAGASVIGSAASAAVRPAAAPPAPPPAAPPSPVALVLEAESGQIAQVVVMVENKLHRQVSATVVTSPFSSRVGEEIRPTLRVQPGTITLEPGGRALVQISALVDDRLESGVRYRGEVTVPGLSDTPIPVMLRRRSPELDMSAAQASSAVNTTVPAKTSAGRARASAKRRTRR